MSTNIIILTTTLLFKNIMSYLIYMNKITLLENIDSNKYDEIKCILINKVLTNEQLIKILNYKYLENVYISINTNISIEYINN